MVPTAETQRIRFFLDTLMERSIPCMLVGNAGTGKTAMVQNKLQDLDDRFMVQNVPFNFYTSSAVLQNVLEKQLEKKAGRNFAPPGNKRYFRALVTVVFTFIIIYIYILYEKLI